MTTMLDNGKWRWRGANLGRTRLGRPSSQRTRCCCWNWSPPTTIAKILYFFSLFAFAFFFSSDHLSDHHHIIDCYAATTTTTTESWHNNLDCFSFFGPISSWWIILYTLCVALNIHRFVSDGSDVKICACLHHFNFVVERNVMQMLAQHNTASSWMICCG